MCGVCVCQSLQSPLALTGPSAGEAAALPVFTSPQPCPATEPAKPGPARPVPLGGGRCAGPCP